jgi:predicted outer membrane repeat protein
MKTRSLIGSTLLTITMFAWSPARAVAVGEAEIWVARSGTPIPPGTSCSSPGFVGSTETAIQAAINAASTGTIVHICRGTYIINTTLTITSVDLSIVGSNAKSTVLDGGANVTSSGNWLNGGVQILSSDSNLNVQGLTLRRGHTEYSGGAVVVGGDLTVYDSIFSSNTANYGGAIFSSGSVTINKSSFTKNDAGVDGGAICGCGEGSAQLEIIQSNFTENHADTSGGAIRSFSRVISSRNTIAKNSAGITGGAIYAGEGFVDSNSKFVKNSASTAGAVWSSGEAPVRMYGSVFTGNSATTDAGALLAATIFISNLTFKNNQAGSSGGAVFTDVIEINSSQFLGNRANQGGAFDSIVTARISTSTFINNRAQTDGGSIRSTGILSVLNTRFRGNRASDQGGGIYFYEGAVTLQGNLFANNRADTGGAIYGVLPEVAGLFASTANRFVGNRAVTSGGALALGCVEDLTATSVFEALNSFSGNTSPQVDEPIWCP